MKLFDFLKNKKADKQTVTGSSYFDASIGNTDLKLLINKAISVFEINTWFTDKQIVDRIQSYCNDENLALALYRFIPIAYCRIFIPEPKYSDEYIVYTSENNKSTFLFSKDRVYKMVLAESRKRLTNPHLQCDVLPILHHSADFKAINEVLNNGSALDGLICSPSYFL